MTFGDVIIGSLCAVLFVLLVKGVFAGGNNRSDTPRPRGIPEDKPLREVLDAITRPAVIEKRTPRYVCGFAFHSFDEANVRPKVVLIRKVKPDWQAGKLNGVGGKIEIGESSRIAMAREFHEETGVHIGPLEWEVFAKMHFPKAEVTFLRCFNQDAALAKTQTVWSDEVQALITEPVEHRHVRGIDEIPFSGIMPNLRWAIPMAWHQEGGRGLVSIDYATHN